MEQAASSASHLVCLESHLIWVHRYKHAGLEGCCIEEAVASLFVAPWAPALVPGAMRGDGCQGGACRVLRKVGGGASAQVLQVEYDRASETVNHARRSAMKVPLKTASSDEIAFVVAKDPRLLASSAESSGVKKKRIGVEVAVDGCDYCCVCNKDDGGDGDGGDDAVQCYLGDVHPHAQPVRQHSLGG